MKNSKGFYVNSVACDRAGGAEMAYKTLPQNGLELVGWGGWAGGCEWHHAAGNRIAFFPKTEKEASAVDDLAEKIKAVKKDPNLPKSKAAVWRGLLDKDAGFGGVDFKEGKYGRFVCSFGEPDGRAYFPSEAFADAAKRLLGIR